MRLFCFCTFLLSFSVNQCRIFNRSVVLSPWPEDSVAVTIEPGGSALNQGQISTISWGMTCPSCCYWNMLTQVKWDSAPYTLGICARNVVCATINLAADEYINGYRTYNGGHEAGHGGKFMKGLWLKSSHNNEYKCGPQMSGTYQYNVESGWISYDNYSLSGFQWQSGSAVIRLRLQFTSIVDDYNCISSTATDPVHLGRGSEIYSPDGASSFTVNDHGIMCLYTNISTHCLYDGSWCNDESSFINKTKRAQHHVEITSTGNVIYGNFSHSVWETQTSTASSPVRLCVKNGGVLSLIDSGENELWNMSHGTLGCTMDTTTDPTTELTKDPTTQPTIEPTDPTTDPTKDPKTSEFASTASDATVITISFKVTVTDITVNTDVNSDESDEKNEDNEWYQSIPLLLIVVAVVVVVICGVMLLRIGAKCIWRKKSTKYKNEIENMTPEAAEPGVKETVQNNTEIVTKQMDDKVPPLFMSDDKEQPDIEAEDTSSASGDSMYNGDIVVTPNGADGHTVGGNTAGGVQWFNQQ